MITTETPRLTIRNFSPDDWSALHKMIVQYQASDVADYDHPWPTSPEEIKGIATWFASGDNFLAVCLKETGTFLGLVSLNPEQDAGQELNIGYIFDADYRGKGYATEACQAVLRHAFQTLKAQRVVTGTAAANQPSCRLLDRLGFKKISESTGTFRTGADGKPIIFLGYSFALSKDEWASQQPG